ncbi:MAG: hypothetical protein AUI05_02550 [Verrucomicrobia bacterium 13_2_20CM_2_54_15_9cls]|nr:MAG: hypothetical protein AUI05_02550 [Verrucomicrobia bacterium 13_2_20CM_2_54_15_9cls]
MILIKFGLIFENQDSGSSWAAAPVWLRIFGGNLRIQCSSGVQEAASYTRWHGVLDTRAAGLRAVGLAPVGNRSSVPFNGHHLSEEFLVAHGRVL